MSKKNHDGYTLNCDAPKDERRCSPCGHLWTNHLPVEKGGYCAVDTDAGPCPCDQPQPNANNAPKDERRGKIHARPDGKECGYFAKLACNKCGWLEPDDPKDERCIFAYASVIGVPWSVCGAPVDAEIHHQNNPIGHPFYPHPLTAPWAVTGKGRR